MKADKNLFVLPTDKPSRLAKSTKSGLNAAKKGKGLYESGRFGVTTFNIHITSDEEIKEGEYGLSKLNEIIKFHSGYDYRYYAKIIMTTDIQLIKDGIQAIDDEFLEWFVKNPSCKFVEVRKEKYSERFDNDKSPIGNPNTWGNRWLAIIPKEEPNIIDQWLEKNDNSEIDKQVEEAAENHWKMQYIMALDESTKPYIIQDFIAGAKWQQEQYTIEEQHVGHTIDELDKEYIKGFNEGSAYYIERMYSEEDMLKSFMACWKANVPEGFECKLSFKEWFEQFKKK